ncbi:MAG: aspartyl-tRNA(Asn)/glutamyl-tRNA(Gln) amidotransferase subunit, partial [Methanolobus sp.]|nr:aspartyl-tRNA(Asn)/glutamyl-tRNA(Gln) amidotransferase subunit [Methanolobus sp.]
FFEEVASKVDPKDAAVWVSDILKGELNYRELSIDAFTVEDIVAVVGLVTGNKITEQSGVEIIRTVLDDGYLGGKEKSLNFIVGKVMQKTKGRADAREAREKVLAKLNE